MHVIAGPNGAGKTTLYNTFIKTKTNAPFINADIIQKDEMKDSSMNASYEAAKIAANRRDEYLKNKKSFVTESVFSHESKLDLVKNAKKNGFKVIVYHVNLRSSNLSVHRVVERVKDGGHNVPEEKIKARYERNQQIIKKAVNLADGAAVFDNSRLNKPPSMAIMFRDGKVNRISETVPSWARELYKEELKPYSVARQNLAAASYADIKNIAKSFAGKDAKALIPSPREKEHKGVIVGESTLHVLQTTKNPIEFKVHFKSNLAATPKITKEVKITHRKNLKAKIEELKQSAYKPKEKLALYDKSLKAKGVPEASRKKILDRASQRTNKKDIER